MNRYVFELAFRLVMSNGGTGEMKELEFVVYSLVWGREKYEQN